MNKVLEEKELVDVPETGWILMICGILTVSFILLVAAAVAFFLTRHRSKIAANSDAVADLRGEVAILREEVERLREEVERSNTGGRVGSSPHIKERDS